MMSFLIAFFILKNRFDADRCGNIMDLGKNYFAELALPMADSTSVECCIIIEF